jgi:two-component system, sensor histidine kinase
MVPQAGAEHDVLVVEDDDDTRELVRAWLIELGFRVRAEVEGRAGIDAACEHPSIALVDIGLPGVDGYEVVRTVREKVGRKIYMVAITGFTSPADVAKCLENGYDAYLAKPLSKDALKRVLNSR